MSKKVVIVIVEGDSDEVLLIERLKELYSGCEVRFESQRCDVFYDFKCQKPIKEVIGNIVREIIEKRKYKPKDILAVAHIIDTDGCMINDDSIKVDGKQEKKTIYLVETINVDSEQQKLNISNRNRERTINVKSMNSVDKIVGKKYNYQIYYFSRNLEHVIFNEPNPEQDLKYENIENFIENLDVKVEAFLLEHLPILENINYPERYKESWNYISNGNNSLRRCTNVSLLFDFINIRLNI